ncbi:MAG: hypothetical protein ACHQJ6_02340 [Candidatus Berkiellales bacterium]
MEKGPRSNNQLLAALNGCNTQKEFVEYFTNHFDQFPLEVLRTPLTTGTFVGRTVLNSLQYINNRDLISPTIKKFGAKLKLTDFYRAPPQTQKPLLLYNLFHLCQYGISSAFKNLWQQWGQEFTDEELLSYFNSNVALWPALFHMDKIPTDVLKILWQRLWPIVSYDHLIGPENSLKLILENIFEGRTNGEALLLVWAPPKLKVPVTQFIINYRRTLTYERKGKEITRELSGLTGLMTTANSNYPILIPIFGFASANLPSTTIFKDTTYHLECLDAIEELGNRDLIAPEALAAIFSHPQWNFDTAFRHFFQKKYWLVCELLIEYGEFQPTTLKDPELLIGLPAPLQPKWLQKSWPLRVNEIMGVAATQTKTPQPAPSRGASRSATINPGVDNVQLFASLDFCQTLEDLEENLANNFQYYSLEQLRRPFQQGPFQGKSVLMLLIRLPNHDYISEAIERFRDLQLADFYPPGPTEKLTFLANSLLKVLDGRSREAFVSIWKKYNHEYTDEELLYGETIVVWPLLFRDARVPIEIFELIWARLSHCSTFEDLYSPPHFYCMPLITNTLAGTSDAKKLMLVWETEQIKAPLTRFLASAKTEIQWKNNSERLSLLTGLGLLRTPSLRPLFDFAKSNLFNLNIFEDTSYHYETLAAFAEDEEHTPEARLSLGIALLKIAALHPKWKFDDALLHFSDLKYLLIFEALLRAGEFDHSFLALLAFVRHLPLSLQLNCLRKCHRVGNGDKVKLETGFTEHNLPEDYPHQERNDAFLARTLIERIESEDDTKVGLAIRSLENIIQENNGKLPDWLHYHGWTPLMSAIVLRKNTLIELLLNASENLTRRSEMGHTVFSLALFINDIPLAKRVLQQIKRSPSENLNEFIIISAYHQPECIPILFNENLLSLDTMRTLRTDEFNLVLNAGTINFLLEKVLPKKRTFSLEIKVAETALTALDDTKWTSLQDLCKSYPFISCTRNAFDVTISANQTATIIQFYEFLDKLQEWLKTNKPEILPKPASEAPTPSQSTASNPEPYKAPEYYFPASPPSPRRHYAAPKRQPQSEVKSQSQSRATGKKEKGSGKGKQPNSKKTKARNINIDKETRRDPKKAQVAQDRPLPYPGPRPPVIKEFNTDLKALSKKEDNSASSVKKDNPSETKIDTELTFIRKLVHERDVMKGVLQGLLDKDDQTVYSILDLALLDNLFKANRSLFLQDKKIVNGDMYNFDCQLIHGVYAIVNEFKQESNFHLFMKACFVDDGLRLLDTSFRDNRPFVSRELQPALENKRSTHATLQRLKVIQSHLRLLDICYLLLEQDDFVHQIALHAINASMINLGEQLARLKEFEPEIYEEIVGSGVGRIIAEKYIPHRNEHHGVNTQPSKKVIFKLGDQFETGLVNDTPDWHEGLEENIIALRKTDLQVIKGKKTQALLAKLIENQTKKCEMEVQVPPGATAPTLAPASPPPLPSPGFLHQFEASREREFREPSRANDQEADVVVAMKNLNLEANAKPSPN